MFSTLFWDVATSRPAIGLDVTFLIAALAVGYFPLVKYLPIVGPYVPFARLVSLGVALLIAFMLGARVQLERETLDKLRATLAVKERDLAIASKSAADVAQRAQLIEAAANAQHESDLDYIATLKGAPGCAFDGDAGGVRVGPAGGNSASNGHARASGRP